MGRAPSCDKNGLKKGPWTPEEDQKLIDYIQNHGYAGNWRTLPRNAGLQRCGKSCRLRWTNYLRPDIKRGRFSFEEEETIIQLHSILGNKWSAIAARLPGRTDNEIKNYWNTHIRKRLLRMGIDPVTHSPRLDLLDLSSIPGSSIYGSSNQMNMSRLLGVHHHDHQVQPLNPELLRLATSLTSSSSQRENPNSVAQNGQQNRLSNLPVENQNNPLLQTNQFQSQVEEILPCSSFVPFSNVDQYLISLQNSQLNHDQWQCDNGNIASSLTQDYVSLSNYSNNNNYYGSDQTSLMDSNNSNQNFSFASVLSTPSSSPTPLNSNSTYINGSSTTTSFEDERDSYCTDDILKFEIPDILDVGNFM